MLVLADVLENLYCIFSLSRSMSKTFSRKIVPVDSTDDITQFKERSGSVHDLVHLDQLETAKTALARSCSYVRLFYKEIVQVIVPIQAYIVLSVLYKADVNSNSLTASWSEKSDKFKTALIYSLDLGVEVVVFVCTLLALRLMFLN